MAEAEKVAEDVLSVASERTAVVDDGFFQTLLDYLEKYFGEIINNRIVHYARFIQEEDDYDHIIDYEVENFWDDVANM